MPMKFGIVVKTGGGLNPVNSRFRLFTEIVAEYVRVLQDPINGRVHSEVSARFFRLDPFVALYFTPLNLQVFFQFHFNTSASALWMPFDWCNIQCAYCETATPLVSSAICG
jgi:hypothetical protein